MTTVREFMTADPECARPEDDLVTVAGKMRDAEVGAIPVCDQEQRPIGILTDRDLVVGGIAAGRDPARTRAGDLTVSEPVCIGASAPIDEATKTMSQHQIRRIPVIDQDQHLIGMLAQADIAREESEQQTGSIVEDISRPPQ